MITCTNCSSPRTPLVVDGLVVGSYCAPCSAKLNVQDLIDAASKAVEVLEGVKGAAEVRGVLMRALRRTDGR